MKILSTLLTKLNHDNCFIFSQYSYNTVDLLTPIVVLAMLAILGAPDKLFLSAASPPDLLSTLELLLSIERFSPLPFDEPCREITLKLFQFLCEIFLIKTR